MHAVVFCMLFAVGNRGCLHSRHTISLRSGFIFGVGLAVGQGGCCVFWLSQGSGGLRGGCFEGQRYVSGALTSWFSCLDTATKNCWWKEIMQGD